ncbi:MAG: beta-lactamase family protein [Actinomycetota bacterium]|nr:beta-lactamase family protein [Actinomycetota bacterium]
MSEPISHDDRTRTAVSDTARYVEQWLALHQRLDRVPGVQLAILHGNDVVASHAFGAADLTSGEPLTTDDRFRIASHSKTFTATAIHVLAERGELRLDDRVASLVSDLDGTPIGEVTLRELLGHGGGVVRDGWRADHWQLSYAFPDTARLVELASDRADVLARNDRFKYSNVGYSVLGLVVEAVTGEAYAAHVQRQLLDPLGLSATTADLDPQDSSATAAMAAGHSAIAFDAARIPIDHIATGAMAPATGFVSTASDVVRWAAAHFFGDERILSDDSKRVMQRTEWQVAGSAGSEYTLGFGVTKINDRRLLGHGGGFPGHITHTLFDPHERIAASVLTNAIDGPAQMYVATVFRLIDLALGAAASETPAVAPDVASRFTGRFANLWGVSDVVELGGRLHLLDPTVGDPTADPIRLDVADEHTTLRITDSPGYAAPGEELVYTRDDDGAVREVRGAGGVTMYPHDPFVAALARTDRARVGAPVVPTED